MTTVQDACAGINITHPYSPSESPHFHALVVSSTSSLVLPNKSIEHSDSDCFDHNGQIHNINNVDSRCVTFVGSQQSALTVEEQVCRSGSTNNLDFWGSTDYLFDELAMCDMCEAQHQENCLMMVGSPPCETISRNLTTQTEFCLQPLGREPYKYSMALYDSDKETERKSIGVQCSIDKYPCSPTDTQDTELTSVLSCTGHTADSAIDCLGQVCNLHLPDLTQKCNNEMATPIAEMPETLLSHQIGTAEPWIGPNKCLDVTTVYSPSQGVDVPRCVNSPRCPSRHGRRLNPRKGSISMHVMATYALRRLPGNEGTLNEIGHVIASNEDFSQKLDWSPRPGTKTYPRWKDALVGCFKQGRYPHLQKTDRKNGTLSIYRLDLDKFNSEYLAKRGDPLSIQTNGLT